PGSVPRSKTRFAMAAGLQAVCPDAPRLFRVVRMQEREMGVPRGAGVDPQAERMVAREAEVVRAACIDECEPARGIRVPGVGRDLVERGLERRRVRRGREIYGAA